MLSRLVLLEVLTHLVTWQIVPVHIVKISNRKGEKNRNLYGFKKGAN